MRHSIAATAVTALVLVVASPAIAADRRVGPGRTYSTIQAAVDAAKPGDRIVLAPGVYVESVTLQTPRISFVGTRGVVWDGTFGPGDHRTCLSGLTDDTLVTGIAFRAGSTHVSLGGSRNRVVRCTSVLARGDAFHIDGDAGRVERNTVTGPGGHGVAMSGTGVYAGRNRVVGAGGYGVSIGGNDAKAEFNTVLDTQDGGVEANGARAVVKSNVILGVTGYGIRADGAGVVAISNRTSHTSNGGIYVAGDDIRVERNRVLATTGTGITADGDAPVVRLNQVLQAVNDASGFVIRSGSGGTIEKNTATDCTEYGFTVATTGATYTGNKVVRCGGEGESGFYVGGTGNRFTSCSANDGDGRGWDVGDTGNTLRSCTASGNATAGFRIGGAGNSVESCTATGNGIAGLVSAGSDVAVRGGKFTGNVQDIARRADATWGVFEGPVFRTGGKDEIALDD